MTLKMDLYAYFHAGSRNHGCEAIVQATSALFDNKIKLFSFAPEEDLEYGIDKFVELYKLEKTPYTFWDKVICVLTEKLTKTEKYGYAVRAKHEIDGFNKGGIALSIGGDNYCYGDAYNYHLSGLNYYLHKKGLKTVLWGCSIEPEMITDSVRKDFSRYDLIVARESYSYEVLKKYNHNTILVCDPAFTLNAEFLPLPKNFKPGKTVGINISPLIQKNESITGITLLNYRNMIRHILDTTDYNIALIPHVVCKGNDDRDPLKLLYQEFENTERIVMIEDCNCKQLKGFISQCVLFIGARTHATIAAYSSSIPTLVIGYSTKAKGIAKDLFGSEEHYVLPVQQLAHETDMSVAFEWLNSHRFEISEHLKKIMPEYSNTITKAVIEVNNLVC